MARRRGSFFLWLLKWVIIPFGLAAIGFYLVGPRIGDELISRRLHDKDSAPTVDPNEPTKEYAEPKIDVKATRID